MPGIFISYRRGTSGGWTGRIHDRLAQHFGEDQVFMDVDDIPAAVDFSEFIAERLRTVDVQVVVIDPDWATTPDAHGRPRIQDSDDLLRREISTALFLGVKVVPVLVDGATMPTADRLPNDLSKLAGLNALELSASRFDADADRLVDTIKSLVTAGDRKLFGKLPPRSAALLFGGGAAVIALILFFVLRPPDGGGGDTTTTRVPETITTAAATDTTAPPNTTAPPDTAAPPDTTEVPVPDVCVESDPVQALVVAGFEAVEIEQFSDDVPAGGCISQNPAPGVEQERGSRVEVVISLGPLVAVNTLDTDGGFSSGVVSGTDGRGLIAYRANENLNLNVAHCSNAACTTATILTVDNTILASSGRVGATSVTVGGDGLALIAYHDVANGDLKVAHCRDTICSSAEVRVIDSDGAVGAWPSIATGADGFGLISYRDETRGDLKVAHCENATCSSARLTTLDSEGDVGDSSSVAMIGGLGLIIYRDLTNETLKAARCSNVACTSAIITTMNIAPPRGFNTSVVEGADGLALVAYSGRDDRDLRVVHCDNSTCSSSTEAVIDNTASVGFRNSLTIGTDGFGLIAYYDGDRTELRVAHCDNTACTQFTINTVDTVGNVGDTNSVTIGADGLPLISYFDRSSQTLKVAHCATPSCG